MAPTQHRIKATRTTRGALLPGHTLVVLDMTDMLIVDAIPCEDAHAQECTLIASALEKAVKDDLWIADRGLCNAGMILGVQDQEACFLVRQNLGTLSYKPTSEWGPESRIATGMVSEQMIEVSDRKSKRAIEVRRIRLVLDAPTRSGDSELFLLTNLPAKHADTARVAETYRRRWELEHAFQVLTEALRCEIDTLAYPGAALLGFCLAIASYNILSAVRSALRSEHGVEAVDAKVSDFHLAQEIASTYAGMMIALPPPAWEIVAGLGPAELAAFLREAAAQAHLAKYPLSRHGPKKPPPRRIGRFNDHNSTARLIQAQKSKE